MTDIIILMYYTSGTPTTDHREPHWQFPSIKPVMLAFICGMRKACSLPIPLEMATFQGVLQLTHFSRGGEPHALPNQGFTHLPETWAGTTLGNKRVSDGS